MSALENANGFLVNINDHLNDQRLKPGDQIARAQAMATIAVAEEIRRLNNTIEKLGQ